MPLCMRPGAKSVGELADARRRRNNIFMRDRMVPAYLRAVLRLIPGDWLVSELKLTELYAEHAHLQDRTEN